MPDKPMQTIEHESGREPKRAVIWLHGLGADGHDFEPIVPELRMPASMATRFIFPHAPIRPVTVNGGMAMRAWYDIYQFGGGRQDADGVRASQKAVDALIEREVARGIDHSRIVVGGFSQGGAIALQTGLRHPHRIAGILALSTYLPLEETLAAEKHAANADIPIFMAHGTQDPVIPLTMATRSRDALTRAGYRVDWHQYGMPHSVVPQEIADISRWLQQVLA